MLWRRREGKEAGILSSLVSVYRKRRRTTRRAACLSLAQAGGCLPSAGRTRCHRNAGGIAVAKPRYYLCAARC